MDIHRMEASVDFEHNKILLEMEEHCKAVRALIEWFKEKRMDVECTEMRAAKVLIDNIEGLCTKIDIRCWPSFTAKVEVTPLFNTHNLGNGAGSAIVIDFMENQSTPEKK